MRHKNKFFVNAVCAGGLATMLLTGCNKDMTARAETSNTETSVTEVSEIQPSASSIIPDENAEDLKTLDSNTKSVLVSANSIENPELVDVAVEDFKKYLGVTFDISQYDTDVTYLEKFENLDAQYSVSFYAPENVEINKDESNVGPDGFPTKEARKKLKPEYYAFYNDDKTLKGLSLLNENWEETSVPISIGECKKIAEEFLKTNNMITGGKIEFVASNVISDFRVYLLYKNGADGGIGIGINTYSSQVGDFIYMDKEQLEINAKPPEEGTGIG